jgi:folate-dependent tRNA-U54 methylase TrmFO/GidA
MKVEGNIDNLFCGGEKAGLLVGHTEAIVTGVLGGHNAVRALAGKDPIILPDSISIGDAVSHVREEMETERGLKTKFTFSGSVYFERMKEKGLYTTDKEAIVKRVKKAGLEDVFNQRVM